MENENKKPSSPPAFPFSAEYGHPAACGGMALRDYFAAKVMQSLINLLSPNDMNDSNYAWISEISYKQADAMLKHREL